MLIPTLFSGRDNVSVRVTEGITIALPSSKQDLTC